MRQHQEAASKLTLARWTLVVVILLLTWALRLCYLEEVPPGWRDDELINIHALSGQVLEGHVPIYYLGASGHEPLYHHLHAVVHAVLGFNVLSGHVLSIVFGTLSVALTYAVARRLFPSAGEVIAVAPLGMMTSFWSLMYSRTAIRHISLLPLALSAVYAMWRQIDAEDARPWGWGVLGLLLGAALYTYTASRLLPVIVFAFGCYLALFHRSLFQKHWRGLVLALVITGVLAAPLGLAIAQGRSAMAVEGIGADARLTELAKPLHELRDGNPRPLLEGIWTTLGMFHGTGDPEWLYNIPGRPVFNLVGGTLFWGGVALCVCHWRRPREFFLILWLGAGLLPAFLSVPPASLSHTILAQPAAYVLPVVAIVWTRRQTGRLFNQPADAQSLGGTCGRTIKPPANHASKRRIFRVSNLLSFIGCSLAALFLTTNAVRDLRDYFVVWPQRGMVRLLYRSDYREAAYWLNAHPELTDVGLGSALMGPWDRLALDVDIRREEGEVRLFNPERALVSPGGDPASPIILTSWPDPAPRIGQLLELEGASEALSEHLTLNQSSAVDGWQSVVCNPRAAADSGEFDNGLILAGACWLDVEDLGPGQQAVVATVWRVAAPLDLPPIPIVANPPPPMVYNGPRLAVFAHLLDEHGVLLNSDDGLWVDPLTLRAGDQFIQLHRLSVPTDASEGPYTVELGLYDPKTGERRMILDSSEQPYSDRLLIPEPKSGARRFKGGLGALRSNAVSRLFRTAERKRAEDHGWVE